jgi:hypothetical protein
VEGRAATAPLPAASAASIPAPPPIAVSAVWQFFRNVLQGQDDIPVVTETMVGAAVIMVDLIIENWLTICAYKLVDKSSRVTAFSGANTMQILMDWFDLETTLVEQCGVMFKDITASQLQKLLHDVLKGNSADCHTLARKLL